MAVDICNDHIGIALAYYRQNQEAPQQTSKNENWTDFSSAATTTSLTALPPIPYMSSDPYHPSYAFLHHHRPETANMIQSLDRVERTTEVADQLAQLAIDRKVNGILVRWPGDLASTVSVASPNIESRREIEEGHLLSHADANRGHAGGVGNVKPDGSMGYMRGRILYVLDACCTSHGHNQNNVHSEPLLTEGVRPFALYDTSLSERNWIAYQQQNKHSKAVHPMIPNRFDKYGNSLTGMDLFGRAAIFGNQPPRPQHGKFRYSSKQQYFGYRVSNQFGVGSSAEEGKKPQSGYGSFDSMHDHESRLSQFQGSLSALHALYDFTKENFEGRIALPLWASAATSTPIRESKELFSDEGSFKKNVLGYGNNVRRNGPGLLDATIAFPASKKKTLVAASNGAGNGMLTKKENGLATLVQMPTRKARRRGKRGL
eukprot:CAMPEP_0181104462 /NCGR_PEP_ID=MMETSP1071-20121207/15446_1 /TAXON_ID=35127 /ORGANISM="Thalassiosira sp., Strain NH16" /LENGTH=429 /DNA_ID=CAMNT_0023187673 /DNA_START=387 /DNA_END=1676 /DNA_ORIENTATION=-